MARIPPSQLLSQLFGVQGGSRPGRRPAGEPAGPARADVLELSPQARAALEALRKMGAMPEVRQEKVAALRAAIAAGTYRPDPREVARRLLESGALDSE
ncbi:MAG: flagellar biosynthesis anti-sigma factor FlgM [Bacillota bacterium]|nr:MAG: flagellar biosynthesis anti-sigma factor FlgM [Bacillota bacterium]